MEKRILFMTPYPQGTAGSQRFRFEQYVDILVNEGFEVDMRSFMSVQTWEILYSRGVGLKKVYGIIEGFIQRLWTLFRIGQFDFVFVHREATPIGPPWVEWWIAKVLRKKLIYDFDDAIWMKNTSKENKGIASLKWHDKVSAICKWAHRVSTGNEFLASYARQFSSNVLINPTTIDTIDLHIPKASNNGIPTIGWTGTHSTLEYLEGIIDPLMELSRTHKFRFLVIADKKPDFEIPNLIYTPWSKETEVEDLNTIDIGVMPLEDNEWSKGKCGFKALQFMALEKPVLVSPVGVNEQIVEHGVSGFHCVTNQDWVHKMKTLLENRELRQEMGGSGRKKVEEEYSVASNKDNFLSLFH